MADRNRDADEGNEALDPELLYSKDYCIGEPRGSTAVDFPRDAD